MSYRNDKFFNSSFMQQNEDNYGNRYFNNDRGDRDDHGSGNFNPVWEERDRGRKRPMDDSPPNYRPRNTRSPSYGDSPPRDSNYFNSTMNDDNSYNRNSFNRPFNNGPSNNSRSSFQSSQNNQYLSNNANKYSRNQQPKKQKPFESSSNYMQSSSYNPPSNYQSSDPQMYNPGSNNSFNSRPTTQSRPQTMQSSSNFRSPNQNWNKPNNKSPNQNWNKPNNKNKPQTQQTYPTPQNSNSRSSFNQSSSSFSSYRPPQNSNQNQQQRKQPVQQSSPWKVANSQKQYFRNNKYKKQPNFMAKSKTQIRKQQHRLKLEKKRVKRTEKKTNEEKVKDNPDNFISHLDNDDDEYNKDESAGIAENTNKIKEESAQKSNFDFTQDVNPITSSSPQKEFSSFSDAVPTPVPPPPTIVTAPAAPIISTVAFQPAQDGEPSPAKRAKIDDATSETNQSEQVAKKKGPISIKKYSGESGEDLNEWLRQIDILCNIKHWNKYRKVKLMKQNLAGKAREWLSRQKKKDVWSSNQLRYKLLVIFGDSYYFDHLLSKMLDRHMKEKESLEDYFSDKLTLLTQCEIYGPKAVSCIIGGLNKPLVERKARNSKFKNTQELYDFLLRIQQDTTVWKKYKDFDSDGDEDDYEDDDDDEDDDMEEEESNENGYPLKCKQSTMGIKCYQCGRMGHNFLTCRFLGSIEDIDRFNLQPGCPDVHNMETTHIRCFVCQELGHFGPKCPQRVVTGQYFFYSAQHGYLYITKEPIHKPQFQNTLYLFSKFLTSVKVNGEKLKAYVDFDSEQVTITESEALRMKLAVVKLYDKYTRGITEVKMKLTGKVLIDFTIDNVDIKLTIYVVPNDEQIIPIIIGKSLLSKPDIFIDTLGDVIKFRRGKINPDEEEHNVSAKMANQEDGYNSDSGDSDFSNAPSDDEVIPIEELEELKRSVEEEEVVFVQDETEEASDHVKEENVNESKQNSNKTSEKEESVATTNNKGNTIEGDSSETADKQNTEEMNGKTAAKEENTEKLVSNEVNAEQLVSKEANSTDAGITVAAKEN